MAEGNYTTFKHVSSGGMAELHLGIVRYETGFKKVCAIKRILAEYETNQTFLDLMRAEACVGETLSHANVIQVMGFGRIDGRDSLIMEYVEGVDLERLIQRCATASMPLSVPMTMLICAEVARALAYIHNLVDHTTGRAMTIIHADISPSNILLSYEGEVKIGDFGIACARLRGDPLGALDVRGKVSYMAPEQAEGQELTAATDIFALGLVMWEMLTGRKLLNKELGPARFEILRRDLLRRRLREEIADLEPEVVDILGRCLTADPKNRYPRAGDLERDLLELIQTHYGSYTRQRVGTFLKTMFSRERDEVQSLIRSALNAPVTQRAAPPSQPKRRAQPEDEDSNADLPLPRSRSNSRSEGSGSHGGGGESMPQVMRRRDLTLAGSSPEIALQSQPSPRSASQQPAFIGSRHPAMHTRLPRGTKMRDAKADIVRWVIIILVLAGALTGAASFRNELSALVGIGPATPEPMPRAKANAPGSELKRPGKKTKTPR